MAPKTEVIEQLRTQLDASQLHAEQLRVAIDRVRSGAAALGLNRIFDIATEALALPRDTSALDAYVAEKVSAARNIDEKQIAYLFEERSALIRKRDLAVAALEAIAGRRIFIDNLASNVNIAVMTLDAIKESEEN